MFAWIIFALHMFPSLSSEFRKLSQHKKVCSVWLSQITTRTWERVRKKSNSREMRANIKHKTFFLCDCINHSPSKGHPINSVRRQTVRSYWLYGKMRTFCATMIGCSSRSTSLYVLMFAVKICLSEIKKIR